MGNSDKTGRRAAAKDLREFAQTILVRAGLRESDSKLVVDNLLDPFRQGYQSRPGSIRISEHRSFLPGDLSGSLHGTGAFSSPGSRATSNS